MKAVLTVVLLLVAAGAVYFAVSQASKEVEPPEVDLQTKSTVVDLPYNDLNLPKMGVPAPGDPKFNVVVELERSKGRYTFHFTVTEEHGWAANAVFVELRHHGLKVKPIRKGDPLIPDRRIKILCDDAPLQFNSELHHAVTVADHEFLELEDFGTSENWSAEVCIYSDLTAPKPD